MGLVTDHNNNSQSTISAYLQQHETKSLLRFITCGSVDDGKSTLIGRLLYDAKLLLDDQISALKTDSSQHGSQNGGLDFALLVDGLSAEREQGITIDVAYRFFATDKRKFIVADCPGHEQYTRNMATGASTADMAIILVDARSGLRPQTRRHSYILSLFGIKNVLLAVNKMDLVGYSKTAFATISRSYRELGDALNIPNITSIPISALHGNNVLTRSKKMSWYTGETLLEYLENVQITNHDSNTGFRMPVQWICRPDQDFRGFAGTIASGSIQPGAAVTILPSGQRSTIANIITDKGNLHTAHTNQAVLLTLTDEIDVSRGDVIATTANPPQISDQFTSHLLWLDETQLLPGRSYWLKIGTRTVSATITEIRHKIDVNSQEQLAAKHLNLNEVARCNFYLNQPIAFESYANNKRLGAFILIDRQSNATVAAGTILFALHRASNIHWQSIDVDQIARAKIKHQKPRCLWFTGLSGSGKSTIANLVEKKLLVMGHHTYLLDGDNIRHGLNKDLGFTDEDRVENIRRITEVAKLMVDAGLIVLTSFISPFRMERQMAREMFASDEFIEIFIDTPLEIAEQRDSKGLYAKARANQIKNFTGIDSPYESPQNPEIIIKTVLQTAEAAAEQLIRLALRP